MISVGSLVGKWVTPVLKDKVPEGEFAAIGSITAAVLVGAFIFICGFMWYSRVGDGTRYKCFPPLRQSVLPFLGDTISREKRVD